MLNYEMADPGRLHKSPPKIACTSLDMGHSPQLGVYKKQWVTKPIGTQNVRQLSQFDWQL